MNFAVLGDIGQPTTCVCCTETLSTSEHYVGSATASAETLQSTFEHCVCSASAELLRLCRRLNTASATEIVVQYWDIVHRYVGTRWPLSVFRPKCVGHMQYTLCPKKSLFLFSE